MFLMFPIFHMPTILASQTMGIFYFETFKSLQLTNIVLLFVDQQRCTETLLAKYGFQNVNVVSTPSDPHVHLSSPLPDDCDSSIPNFPYQEIVGSLLYLATHSRPNIAQAVSVVSQYATN